MEVESTLESASSWSNSASNTDKSGSVNDAEIKEHHNREVEEWLFIGQNDVISTNNHLNSLHTELNDIVVLMQGVEDGKNATVVLAIIEDTKVKNNRRFE